MEGYTTILIKKSTRDKLARRKRYGRESYDETIERLSDLPDHSTPARAQPKEVQEALERLARFCDGPKTSDAELEAKLRRVEEMETRDARNLHMRLPSPARRGRKTGLQKV